MIRKLLLGAVCAVFMGVDCGGYDPVQFDVTACPPPTIEQCQDPKTACDNHFQYLGKKDPDSPCSLLLSQAAVSAAAGYPEKLVLKPTTYSGLSTFKPDAGTALVHAVPEDSELTGSGLSSFAFGQRTQTALKLRGADPIIALAARQALAQKIEAFNANGNALASCEEYAFEKYFDIAAWDAQVLISNATSNHRKAFDIAFATDGSRTAIGTRHLDDNLILGRDGTDSDLVVPFDTYKPKNDYFRVPKVGSAKVVFQKGAIDSVTMNELGQLAVTMKDLQRSGMAFNGVQFDDTELAPLIASGQHRYVESFKWHQQMSNRNASLPDDQLLIEHERRDAFLALLEQRDEVTRQIAEYVTGGENPPPVAGGNRYATRWWLEGIWNPDPNTVGTIASMTADRTTVDNFPTSFNQQQQFITYSNTPSPTKKTMSPSALATLGTGPNVQKPCNGTGNPFFCLVYRLADIDQAIEDELHAAQDRGCLDMDPDPNKPAPCDWSPRDFTQRLRGLSDVAREKAFRKCDESVDSFVDLQSRALVQDYANGNPGVNFPAQNYTLSPTDLELFFTRQTQYLLVLGDVVGPLLERKMVNGTNKLRLARTEGESHQIGDKLFGANLSYSLGFAMEGLPAEPVDAGTTIDDCVITTRADARFGLVASVLTFDIPLATASVHADDHRFDTRVQVLDQVWEIHQALTDGTIPVFTDSQMEYQQFFEATSTFAIGYILISIGAAVSGGVGYGVDVEVGRKTIESNGCQVSRIGVYPTIVPLTFVEGSAYAALEAVVARAGIKGYLTLASISVPIAGEVSLGPTENDPTIIDAAFRISASLSMHFFGGRICVFAEIGVCPLCASFEADLIAWEGIRQGPIELFDYGITVRLGDLKRIARQQGVLAPVAVPP